MKSRRYIFVFLALALIALTSCSEIYAREIYEESPHVEQHDDGLDSSDLEVGSLGELKSAIIYLVRAGKAEGVIKLARYQGDPERDLPSVVGEVCNDEPIGKYAVYLMSYELKQVLSNYHANVFIRYHDYYIEKMSSIVQTSGYSGYKGLIEETMREYGESLIVEMTYYDESQYDPAAIVKGFYYSNPSYAVGFPEIQVSFYPDSSLRRIVELKLDYPGQPITLKNRASRANTAAQEMAGKIDRGEGAGQIVLNYHDMLLEAVEYAGEPGLDSEDADLKTIYGAFVLQKAAGEGYALAFKRLCDLSGIPCRVVQGRFKLDDHVWNLVELEGNWYHIDVATDDLESSYGWFLKTDEDMRLDHNWSDADYPRCVSSEISLDTLRPPEPFEGQEGEPEE